VLIVSNTSAVELKVDPSVVLATRKYVDDVMAAHKQSRDHPNASETEKGFTRYATQAEVNEAILANQKTDAVVTVKTLWGWAKQASETVLGLMKVATQAQANAGAADDVVITPKKLRFGFSANLVSNGYIVFPSWLGGLILQWGVTTTTGTSQEISFPLTFTGSVFGVFVIPQQSGGSASAYASWQPVSMSKFKANFSTSGFTVNYFALGN